ncbi:hypothetical protein MUK60_07745 [Streptomyces sp. LRE541]|uniref:hypothetical protein n=1 Tax=Streptomyces sp. LRE541 TaxID=2931983 RepID=UPI00200BA57E|nr:hypothetical protein [Streptomyces sp. LRE541]UPZ27727.1 hypothetical protein MUK60_07745 [Streptomyces sp. LRE541]
MTFTPKPFQSPPPHISRADVPLSTLRERMTALVERQRRDAAVERLRLLLAVQPHRPATPGEAAELRHLLHDADPDLTVPAFPYPNAKETP